MLLKMQCHSMVTALCCVAVVLPAAYADEKHGPAEQYRAIFNCDGHAVCMDAQGDVEQWIENLFGPLENSQVDALFWCDGSGGNTANYNSDVLELTGKRAGKPRPWIQKLLDEGHDPPQVVVSEAKKRGLDVFYSFRINDIHDSFMPDELATFKVEHPEWQIGKQKYGDVTSYPTSLNFAIPEVRELKFRVIEEIFQKYGFDGLEIDFMRSAPYFLPGEEAAHAHLLTELLQRVRKHLDQRGLERGRPVRLAVRVGESLRSCRLDGFEVSKWIDDGLIDYVILGSGVMDIEVGEFRKLAESKGVFVYPCLYGWPSKYSPIPAELAAGLALNYWHQGADGIYLFNWFPHTIDNSESTGTYMAPLLLLIDDPAALAARQNQLMFAADRGRPQASYPHNWMSCVLPAPLPADQPLDVSFYAGIDVRKQTASYTAELQVTIDQLQADDVIEVALNQKSMEALQSGDSGRLTVDLPAEHLRAGRNEAALTLVRRSSNSEEPLMVIALEVHLKKSELERPNAECIEQHELKEGSAAQGLALAKDVYFTSSSRTLYRYDSNWNLQDQKNIEIPGVNHVGAIHYHDGFAWAGLLHGPEGGQYDKALDRSIIAKIRADDLEIVQTWDITDDVKWIDPVCFDGAFLWVGDLSDLGIHRYTIQGDRLERDGIFRYPRAMHFSQGVRVVGNKLYSIHTFGEMDGLFEFNIPETLTDAINHPTRVWNIQETHSHLEGFGFVPGKPDQIWHAQGSHVDRYRLEGLAPIAQ